MKTERGEVKEEGDAHASYLCGVVLLLMDPSFTSTDLSPEAPTTHTQVQSQICTDSLSLSLPLSPSLSLTHTHTH